MHHYNPNEMDWIFGDGVPTASADTPTRYVDRLTGSSYQNLGGGTTWTAPSGLKKVKTLTTSATLTEADSGSIIYLNAAGGGTITLPANTLAGFWCEFVVKIIPTSDWDVAAATADTMSGSVLSSSGGAEDTEAAATADKFTFIANTSKVGDRARVDIDGTSVHATAICSTTGGVLFQG